MLGIDMNMKNINEHPLKNVANNEKLGYVDLVEDTLRGEEIVKYAKPIVSKAEMDAERAESMNRSIVITLNGTTLRLNAYECSDYSLTDLIEMASNKKEYLKLKRYLRGKYGSMKLTLPAFCKETLLSEPRAINCYRSLNDEPPKSGIGYWFSIDDTILIIQMMK